MASTSTCERARPGAADPCPTHRPQTTDRDHPPPRVELSAGARRWVAGVPWYDGCLSEELLHRAAAGAAAPGGVTGSIEALRRCCECLLWDDAPDRPGK
jgi:hypothetical protein